MEKLIYVGRKLKSRIIDGRLRITDRRRTWRRITELQEIKIWSKGGEEEQLSKTGEEEEKGAKKKEA